jgi:hypothetical protein
MASGYRNAAGVDIDDIYDPDIVGDGPVATGFRKSDGSLLRYAAIQYGSKAPDIGYRLANGADLSTLWAKKGSAQYVLADPGYWTLQSNTALAGGSVYSVVGSLSMAPDGTWQVLNYTQSDPGHPQTGHWYQSTSPGIGSSYQARLTFTLGQGTAPTLSNNASDWHTLGDSIGFSATLKTTTSQPLHCTGTLRVQIRRTSDQHILSDVNVPVSLNIQQL